MPTPPKNLREFSSLIKVVEDLRGPQGCPWDKEQTHQTLTRYAIEEAFELSEAIDSGVKTDIVEELGDMLLQVVLHAEIGRQSGEFTLEDVIESISAKMVRRHPHVFGDVKVTGSSEVLKNWAEIKAEEKSTQGKPLSFDIPQAMPALIRSQKIGEKTAKTHFDWGTPDEVFRKVDEEISELKEALDDQAPVEKISSEIGDTLFSLAQLARHLHIDSEQALRQTNQRFERRFQKMQELVKKDGLDWAKISSHERENYWQAAKAELKSR